MRPVAYDFFCCAGGATKGLQRAGYYVIGVDIKPQPRYCGDEFIQADAMEFLERHISADFIWASPPCQGYTPMRHAPGAKGTAPRLIAPVRDLLQRLSVPWVIENVAEAASEMRAPITLCGSMFGLGAQGCQLQRHRLFENNFGLQAPSKCSHVAPTIGVYGGHARKRSAAHGGRGTKDVWIGGHKVAASEAMDIDWMTLGELSEAIPPAYSEYIGREALKYISAKAA